jgi:hypothetical protein
MCRLNRSSKVWFMILLKEFFLKEIYCTVLNLFCASENCYGIFSLSHCNCYCTSQLIYFSLLPLTWSRGLALAASNRALALISKSCHNTCLSCSSPSPPSSGPSSTCCSRAPGSSSCWCSCSKRPTKVGQDNVNINRKI